MKRVWQAEDGETFGTLAACRAYEQSCQPPVAVPWQLFREILRQCSPYMVRAQDRYDLKTELLKLVPVGLRKHAKS